MCVCKQGISNTGTPNCAAQIEVPVRLFVQNKYDNDGVKNRIDLTSYVDSSDLDDTFFAAMINDSDKSQRLYPLPLMKNVENAREDNRMEGFNDGSSLFIGQGVRKFKAVIVGKDASPQLAGKLDSLRCTDFGVYMAGASGSFIGNDQDTGYLSPIDVDQDSWSAKYIPATDTNVQKIEIAFNLEVGENDKYLRAITAEEMDCDVKALRGLLDVYTTIVSTTQTVMTLDLYTDYGTAVNKVAVEGLVTADFISSVGAATSKIRNTTDSADLAVVAAESSTVPGRYTLTYASQTVADVLQPLATKNGFDFTPMIGTLGTVV